MASRFDLYYGLSGAGKSRAGAEIIRQLFMETGKKSRVLVGDGSAATYTDMGLVDCGAVEVMDYTIRDWPISTLEQLAEGAWPADPEDPKSPLVSLTPERAATMAVTVFEGLAVAGLYIMGDKKGGLAYRSGQGEKIGQDSPIRIVDGEVDLAGKAKDPKSRTYGGNPISHFNVGQQRLRTIFERSKMLPGWVIWTSHEKGAENKQSGEKIIGPEGVGNADTPNLPRAFGNTLHFATAEKPIKLKDEHTQKEINVIDAEYRIYFKNHFKAEGTNFVKYLANARITYPDMLPKVGYFESDQPGKSILDFYGVIEASRKRALAETLLKNAA